jgi:hypothetical protein
MSTYGNAGHPIRATLPMVACRRGPAVAQARPTRVGYRSWLVLLGSLAVLAIACFVAGGAARFAWIIGVGALGTWAWSRSMTFHLQAVTIAFVLSPILRRVVDVHAGYEPSGLMLIAPLIALLAPCLSLLTGRRPPAVGPAGRPFWLALGCLSYGIAVTAFRGDAQQALVATIKLLPPVIYALFLLAYSRKEPDIASSWAATMFCAALAISAYGIVQYVVPQDWDRYWMINSQAGIWSIGLPEPFKIRVFGTMASPAGFATFLTCTCLLLTGWRLQPSRRVTFAIATLALVPIFGALLLTAYRTAWVALMSGIIFLALRPETRGRSLVSVALITAAIVVAISLNPSNNIVTRLETFGNSAETDVSAQGRLQEYAELYEDAESLGLGEGYRAIYPLNPRRLVDGTIIESLRFLGFGVGLVLLGAIVWSSLLGVWVALRAGGSWAIALASVNVASLMLVPFEGVLGNELGFLYWSFAALAASCRSSAARSQYLNPYRVKS